MAAIGLVVDEFDEPVMFRIKGMDPSDKEAVYTCQLEARPGGNAVFRVMDMRPIQLPVAAANYLTEAEARTDQLTRAEDTEEREKEAARMERQSREADQRETAAAKARKQAARTGN